VSPVYSSTTSRHSEASPISRNTCHGVRRAAPSAALLRKGISRNGQSRIWRR
jgi:hypothetical protein